LKQPETPHCRPTSNAGGRRDLQAKRVIAQAALDRFARNLETAEQAVAAAKTAEERARLAYQSDIGSENTAVAQVRQQAASVMPFVCERDERNRGVVVASFMQGHYLQIKPGDYAEVVFPMYSGRVFSGKVLTTIDVVARSNEPLQSEAGYIDARPQTRSTNLLATHGRTIHWVKGRHGIDVRGTSLVPPDSCRICCAAEIFGPVP
jgi:multidrug resistance efflux pump